MTPSPTFLPLAERGPAARRYHPPPRPRWWPSSTASLLVLGSLLVVLLERLTAVAGDLQLFADGSWFLVRVASTQSWYFWIGDWHRQWFQSRAFTILAEQTPVVLASRLGVHSLHALSLVFGLVLYSHALLALYICYRYTAKRWYMVFPLLSFYAGSMNAEALQLSDSHFVLSLYWPAMFILLFREELRRGTLLLLLALSVPMVLSYESMVFFGIVLAGVCCWRWRKSRESRRLMAGLALWYLCCSVVSLASIIMPFDMSNKSGFFQGLISILNSDHLGVKSSVAVLVCCTVLLFSSARVGRMQTLVAGIGFTSVGYQIFQVLVGRAPLTLNSQMAARTLNLLTPLVATALLIFVLSRLFNPDRRAIQLTAMVVAALGIGQAAYGFGCLMLWQGMLATLRYELMLHEGPIGFGDSVMSRDQLGPLRLRYLHATWPLLPLSLYESEHGDVKSIVLTDPGGYLPFDPFAVSSFPDLSRYGVHYDSYEKALKRTWEYRLGETLTFPRGGSALQFLSGAWSTPENWATWSEGQDFGIRLPLHESELPETVALEVQLVPNLSEEHPRSSAEVLVNGVPIGVWEFHYVSGFQIRTMTAMISRDILRKGDPVEIQFHVREPILSPTELGKGNDPRKLALAFLKMRLYPVR